MKNTWKLEQQMIIKQHINKATIKANKWMQTILKIMVRFLKCPQEAFQMQPKETQNKRLSTQKPETKQRETQIEFTQ